MPGWRFEFRIVVAVAMLLLGSKSFGATTWILTDAQFKSRSISVDSIDASGIHGAGTVLPWDNVLELSQNSNSPAAAAPGRFTLFLSSGDSLSGEPVALNNDSLQWHSGRIDAISFPVGSLQAIVPSGAPAPDMEQIRTDDVIHLANGDSTHGIITQITSGGVTIQAGDATPTLPWESIAAVLFSTATGSPAASDRRMFRLHFAGDESLTAQDITLGDGKLSVALDGKNNRELDPASVTAIEQINGPISWLTARKPAQNIYKPFFLENFPTRFDRTVADGKPIREKYPAFHHGIGCHSYSKLVYDIGGKWGAFRTQFAIDSDSPLADVTVRIYLDDKQVFEKKNVKAGSISPLEVVPLGNARTLALEVDYGENYATEDRFVWLDSALVRTLPPAMTEPSGAASAP